MKKHKKAFWILASVIAAAIIGIFAGGYIALAKGIPSVAELTQYKSIPGTKIYADDDVLIGEIKIEKGIFVPLDRMPKHLVNAVVAVEDSRFWKHKGIDYIAILRASIKDVLHAGLKEGGSTITQQLAKITFLTHEKTLLRKIREAALAIEMEKKLNKKEILELYLNRIYLGHGAYGMEMAAKIYFGKSVKDIALHEAALLSGLIKAPTTYSPYNNLTKARERQETALMRMEDEGFIKRSEKERALKQPINLSTLRSGQDAANYFIDYTRKYLEEKYGTEAVYRGGLSVYTTLDRKAQLAAARSLQDGLRELDKRRGWRGPIEHREIDAEEELKKKDAGQFLTNLGDIATGIVLKAGTKEAVIKARGIRGKLHLNNAQWASRTLNPKNGRTTQQADFSLDKILKVGDVVRVGFKSAKANNVELTLEQEPDAEGAVVTIEPHTGFIRAMVGGYDYSKSEYNRAVSAKRQPGSAFKPVIYAAAMDNGFTPSSIINDEPVTFRGGPKGDWSPENYDHKHYGPTRLREALTYSRNIVTVKLVDAMGVDAVIDFSKKIGFEGDIPRNLSIALGSISATPLELALSYTVFAGAGMKMKPVSIKYITDSKGRILEDNEPEGQQVISPQTAFLITSMMTDVVNYGTGWRIKAMGRPVAGKTGTTNDYRDAWFVGYTPELVTSVWVGFDDMRSLGAQETGARAASPVWLNFMKTIEAGQQTDFTIPEGIVSFPIDPANGLLARTDTGLKEYFKAGTQPREYSSNKPSAWQVKEPLKIDLD